MDAALRDRVVLITGASGGIGQATARAFAAEGARLGLHYHRRREPVEVLRRSVGVDAVVAGADLRDETQTEAMFAEVTRVFPRIDALVVNAGIWNPGPVPLKDMTLEQWQETIGVDLTSAMLTCRAYLRHLAAVGGEFASIVLVGSTAALFGEAAHADYAAAKAGVVYGLTRSLKNEIVRLIPQGRVNCVCPGWTDTPMAVRYTGDREALARATATMSLGKIARPEDVASAIVFLSSERLAGHISGAILPIAGGMEGRLLHP